MTATLGQTPKYIGWLNLADGGYGFVFEGAEGPILSAWSSKGPERQIQFANAVSLTDVGGTTMQLAAKQPLVLGKSPVYVSGIPADMIAEAKANAGKPFPWGGDFANATEVTCALGATNTENGITQRNPKTTEVVHKLDHSFRISHRKNGEGIYAYFRVDPQFVSFGNKDLEITIIARRNDSDKAVSVDLTYEAMKGYKGTGARWQIPEGEEWIEHTWTVHDANFVGGWGWNFRTDIGGSAGTLAIKEVRVRKIAAPTE